MTKLFKHAIALLQTLPDDLQDQVARQLIRYVQEIWDYGGDFD